MRCKQGVEGAGGTLVECLGPISILPPEGWERWGGVGGVGGGGACDARPRQAGI